MMKRNFLLLMILSFLSVSARDSERTCTGLHSEKAVKEKLADAVMACPSWVEGTDFLIYETMEGGHVKIYVMNAEDGKKEPLISDVPEFVRQYAALTGDTAVNERNLRIFGIRINGKNAGTFTFRHKGKAMLYDRGTGRLVLHDSPHDRSKVSENPIFGKSSMSEDSLYTMLGDRYNLYIKNNITGKIRQLTVDGKEYASYCHSSRNDSLSDKKPAGAWYGHRYVCLMQDDSEVGDLYLLNALSKPRPTLKTKKMPLPNEAGIRRSRIFWYDADGDKMKQLPIERFKDQKVTFDYTLDGKDIYFTRRNRTADSLELCHVDIQTGKVRILISEQVKPHLNVNEFNYRLICGNRQILWWSDRTGRGNYYLYDINGKLLNRVTSGDKIVAGNILYVDSLSRRMVFAGYGAEKGTDPNYACYYVAALNGKKQYCLTPGAGQHELTVSGSKKYAIDKFSRMDMPPVYRVISLSEPKKIYEIKRIDEQTLLNAGWIKPRLIQVKAADEKTDLYGVMYLPANLDETKKYPIISNVYPGPQSDQIPRSFVIDDNGNQSLADLGFVVINVQPRGSSPVRSKEFYSYGYGNLRDYPLADDRHTIEMLARQYRFIDLGRVGIYGHSGGGFQTVAAMLTYPDFYRVGVAASGNHDNNIYIQWWGETYHGLGKIPTNMELADRLKGKLLLVTGDMDDNVPYASTLRMADALIKAGKRFDMFVFPGMDHSLYGTYYDNMIRHYFVEHLLGKQDKDSITGSK